MFKVNTRYKIKTPTGYENFAGVLKKKTSRLYTFTFDDGSNIICSGGHAFLTENGFQKAETITKSNTITGKIISDITYEDGNFDVYDPVSVANHSSYYSNGVISHNTEFIGSSSTLISGSKITQLMSLMENPIKKDGYIDIYHKPVEGHTYVLSADVAEGQELDYSCFSIMDVTTLPYVHVAKYRNNAISPLLYPTEIYRWAKEYNNAFVLVEINSIGLQVADILYNDFNYENMIRIKPATKTGQKMSAGNKKTNLGLKQSVQTKKIGCANLKTLIENDKIITHDIETISELTTFVINKSSYAAEAGKNDDLVMTLVNFAWLTSQSYFRDNVGQDIRTVLQREQLNILDTELMPMIQIDDGLRNLDNDQYMDDREIWLEDVSRNYPLDDLNYDWGYNRRF